MRKLFSLGVGLFIASGLVLAQSHDNMNEKPAKDTVTFASPVIVGSTVLPAGDYKIVCDRKTIVFTRLVAGKDQEGNTLLDPLTAQNLVGSTKALEVPCKGRELKDKVETTVVELALDKDGNRHLDKLFLKGSNVEHVFD
jgi:hypothetical protein